MRLIASKLTYIGNALAKINLSCDPKVRYPMREHSCIAHQVERCKADQASLTVAAHDDGAAICPGIAHVVAYALGEVADSPQ